MATNHSKRHRVFVYIYIHEYVSTMKSLVISF